MLSKEELFVLDHYLNQGIPKTAIAGKLGISRMTIYRHMKCNKGRPAYGPRPAKPSLLGPYRDYIRGRLRLYPELTSVRLLSEIRERGYSGKYTALKDFVREERPKAPIQIEQRFEVSPAEQAQVDFATFKTPFGTVYALLVVLSWSRYLWVRFYCHQDQLTVLGGLSLSFQAFGGVPETLLFDRMKTAVVDSDSDGHAIFSEELLRFARHAGFRPMACRPYRAKTKGRVERAVSYLRKSFFYGRIFRDMEDLNSQLGAWLKDTANTRIHGTTGAIPAERLTEERAHLLPLPDSSFVPMVSLGRRIGHDGYISYNGNDYSVPEGLLSREVTVMASLEEVKLYQSGELIAVHPLLEGNGHRRLDPRHRSRQRAPGDKKSTSQDILTFLEVERRPLAVYEGVLR